jgi:hypothetical protein
MRSANTRANPTTKRTAPITISVRPNSCDTPDTIACVVSLQGGAPFYMIGTWEIREVACW